MKKNIEKYLKEIREDIMLERFDTEAKVVINQKKINVLHEIQEKEEDPLKKLVISKAIDTLLSEKFFFERTITSLNEKYDYYNIKAQQK